MNEYDWTKDIRINPNNILKSMWEQTDIFAKYAKKYADCQSKKLSLQRKIKLLESDVELKIRQNPSDYGIEDVKEAAIKATIQSDRQLIELGDEMEKVQKELNVWTQALSGCDHRRSMLKYMTELISKNVWSVPDFIEQHKLDKARTKLAESDHLQQLQEGYNQRRKRNE